VGDTKIEWTGKSWNPVTGCDKVSPGCANCYAFRFAERFRGVAGHYFENGFDVTLRPNKLRDPESWTKGEYVFVNSMSDLFHAEIPEWYIDRVFDVMERVDRHVYQILTKRPQRMRAYVNKRYPDRDKPCPAHIWLGVSVESADYAFRADMLRATNARVRWISAEPLLDTLAALDLDRIDWVVTGGESGPGAREMQLPWPRELRDKCVAAGVPFFLKQLGGKVDKRGGAQAKLDGRGWKQWPDKRPAA
jgi:protein gp37